MRIERAADGSWTVVRDDGSLLPGYPTAESAATALDALTASVVTAVLVDEETTPLVAAITGTEVDVPARPPAEWFQDPGFDDSTTIPVPSRPNVRGCPVTITDDGQIYGHAATWGTYHIGYQGQKVPVPHSRSGYAYFRHGQTVTADGSAIATGPVTVATGHADEDPNITAGAARSHYDNTGAAVADVAAGEDRYGIWVAGAIRPGATVAQVEALRRSSLSGDWRDVDGHHEMVAALAVNTPGFPIPRYSLAASGAVESPVRVGVREGKVYALVAAGSEALAEIAAMPWLAEIEPLRQQITVLEKQLANWAPAVHPLAASAARERLTAAMAPKPVTPGAGMYADPGYQKDGKKRYPVDTAAHCRAALSFLAQGDNAKSYTAAQLASIKTKIKAAAQKFGITVSAGF